MTGKTLLVTYKIKMKKQLLLTGITSIIKLRKENRWGRKNFAGLSKFVFLTKYADRYFRYGFLFSFVCILIYQLNGVRYVL